MGDNRQIDTMKVHLRANHKLNRSGHPMFASVEAATTFRATILHSILPSLGKGKQTWSQLLLLAVQNVYVCVARNWSANKAEATAWCWAIRLGAVQEVCTTILSAAVAIQEPRTRIGLQ